MAVEAFISQGAPVVGGFFEGGWLMDQIDPWADLGGGRTPCGMGAWVGHSPLPTFCRCGFHGWDPSVDSVSSPRHGHPGSWWDVGWVCIPSGLASSSGGRIGFWATRFRLGPKAFGERVRRTLLPCRAGCVGDGKSRFSRERGQGLGLGFGGMPGRGPNHLEGSLFWTLGARNHRPLAGLVEDGMAHQELEAHPRHAHAVVAWPCARSSRHGATSDSIPGHIVGWAK